MSLIDTPSWQRVLASSAIPPGLSETVTENLTRRPSAARPRSRQRPRIVVSILPPHKGITILKIKDQHHNVYLDVLIKPLINEWTKKGEITFCQQALVRDLLKQLQLQMHHHPQRQPFPFQPNAKWQWQSILLIRLPSYQSMELKMQYGKKVRVIVLCILFSPYICVNMYWVL